MRAEETKQQWVDRVTTGLIDRGELAEWPGEEARGFLYRPTEVMVDRRAYETTAGLRSALATLGGRDPLPAQRLRVRKPIIKEVTRSEPSLRFQLTTTQKLPEKVAELAAEGYPVDCNYILASGGSPKWHPGDDPEYGPPVSPLPNADLDAGRGVKVAVIDTGLFEPATQSAADLLSGVIGEPDWLYEETPGPEADVPGYLLEAGGHGTFVAGLVRRVAPAAEIFVFNAGTKEGFADLGQLLAKMEQAFRHGCQVINISMGTYTLDDQPLRSFDEALVRLREEYQRDVAVVASAGNDGIDRKGWPAASEHVIGVAALDWQGNLCSFSNRGPWVKAATYGEKLWSVFVPGAERDGRDPDQRPEYWRDHFRGAGSSSDEGNGETVGQWAEWSGTSFAAPLVTGALAVGIAGGKTASDAAADLLATASKQSGGSGLPRVEPTFQIA
jgi:subtilisin family serine protease